MRIGVIAYNAACNFGANLQLLSTVSYLKNNGHYVSVINWVPETLEAVYKKKILERQQFVHIQFRKKYYNETKLCRNAEQIADVIKENRIEAVIIGSDAVAQHHPFMSRIHFPSRKIVSIIDYPEDCMFPNPFWGTFNDYLEKPVPIAVLSASCQNSSYKLFSRKTEINMFEAVKKFSFLSTRDDWTQKMYESLSHGKICPDITPDPVFGFNYNVNYVPTKDEILKKFNLKDNYILFGLFNNRKLSLKWLSKFDETCKVYGIECAALAFPEGVRFKHPFSKEINTPLDPLDWYALIKYAKGYIGHNMHPIVVALHNLTPFFSFDNYGITRCGIFVNEKSSKIYHILERAGFLDNRFSDLNLISQPPSPEKVFYSIRDFDKEKCSKFAKEYLCEYQQMMDKIIKSLKMNINV